MRKAAGVLLLALAVLLSLSLWACSEKRKSPWSPSEADPLSESYQAGYGEGYNTGLLAGEMDHRRGLEWNETAPIPQGDYDNDYMTGFSDGYKDGYREGQALDPMDDPKYKEGYRVGFNAAAQVGYDQYMNGEVSPYGFNCSSQYLSYEEGYEKGAEDGYNYGIEYAKSGKKAPWDWYAEYVHQQGGGESAQSGGESGSTDKELRDYVPGSYTHDSWSDSHFEYQLNIFKDLRYDISYYPKGGQVAPYSEQGQCQVDETDAGLTFNASEINGERPEELDMDRPWKIALEYNGDFVLVILTDGNGNKWPCDGLESR